MSRRLVFISGGLTHASFGGIGIGIYTGISPLLCATLFSVFSALGVEWLSKKKEVREDSAIAVFWTLGMAVGVMFSFLAPGFAPDLSTYLFGNILTISTSDLVFQFGVMVALVLFFLLFLETIIMISFDGDFARSRGVPVLFFEYALMVFMALTIVSSLRVVGIVLVISLLTIPQMTANLFTKKFASIILLSILFGLFSCIGGLLVSFYFNVPSGASIIFTSVLIFILCKLLESAKIKLSYKKAKYD